MKFGSLLARRGAEVDLLPPTLKLTSLEDMCTERGGITLLIFLMIVIPYFIWQSEVFIVGNKENSGINLSYYGQNNQAKQSLFRRFMVAIEKVFVLPFIPSSTHAYVMWIFMIFFVTTIPMAVSMFVCYVMSVLSIWLAGN